MHKPKRRTNTTNSTKWHCRNPVEFRTERKSSLHREFMFDIFSMKPKRNAWETPLMLCTKTVCIAFVHFKYNFFFVHENRIVCKSKSLFHTCSHLVDLYHLFLYGTNAKSGIHHREFCELYDIHWLYLLDGNESVHFDGI